MSRSSNNTTLSRDLHVMRCTTTAVFYSLLTVHAAAARQVTNVVVGLVLLIHFTFMFSSVLLMLGPGSGSLCVFVAPSMSS
jgi:hypothetical protein